METPAQDVPGYYVWAAPDKPLQVHLRVEVIDRLLSEVMRGFGAVPKRGAEVGGILIGTIEDAEQTGEQAIVHVEDFQAVPCAYRRGPSYLFTEEESATFGDACERWQPDPSRPAYAVGLFRSHTRDGLALSPEDIELLDRYFAGPSYIALLIKPFATKASPAGFFFRENGVFPEATPLQFPFRRRELTGEEEPARRALPEPAPRERRPPPMFQSALLDESVPVETDPAPPPPPAHDDAVSAPPRPRLGSWMWIPLSFIFLLLGVALGFQAATTMGFRAGQTGTFDPSLALKVTKLDDNLTIRWNSEAPAVRNAQRGVLEIQDGSFSKPVDLDAANLQNGSIIYRNTSNVVHFRLIVYFDSRVTVTETLDWRQ